MKNIQNKKIKLEKQIEKIDLAELVKFLTNIKSGITKFPKDENEAFSLNPPNSIIEFKGNSESYLYRTQIPNNLSIPNTMSLINTSINNGLIELSKLTNLNLAKTITLKIPYNSGYIYLFESYPEFFELRLLVMK